VLFMAPASRATIRQHGPAIRALRQKDGLSVQEFANLLGISYSHLQNLEHENKKASREHLNKAARLLGVPLVAIARNEIRDVADEDEDMEAAS
jgi:transcriptional regulator with XRE-family HTH domain